MGEERSQNIMGRGWLKPYLYLTHTSPCPVHEQEQPSRLHENYWEVGHYTVCPVWRLVRDNHISLGCLVWSFQRRQSHQLHGDRQCTLSQPLHLQDRDDRSLRAGGPLGRGTLGAIGLGGGLLAPDSHEVSHRRVQDIPQIYDPGAL
jgi:hypothetical protein